MARTLRYSDILEVVTLTLPKDVAAQYVSVAANLATNLIWYAYDWRESLEPLRPFYLIPGEQDFKTQFSVLPADFHSLRKCQLCRYSNGTLFKWDMDVTKDLLLTHIKGTPRSIAYEPTTASFRLFPRVSDSLGCPEWFIEGTYKKRPAAITNATIETFLPFDDMYQNVWIEVLRWAFLSAAGSPAAGEVQMNGSQIVYTGQLGKAMAAVEGMAQSEGSQDGDPHIAPSEPLVGGSFVGYTGIPLSGWG